MSSTLAEPSINPRMTAKTIKYPQLRSASSDPFRAQQPRETARRTIYSEQDARKKNKCSFGTEEKIEQTC